MKKTFLASLVVCMAMGLYAGEELVVNGTVRLGVNSAAIGLGIDTKHSEDVPVMVDVVRDGKPCLVLAQVERYGFGISHDIASVSSITCDGEKSKTERGWIYDENGNFGVPQLLSGTKVKVAFVPNSNLLYSFK